MKYPILLSVFLAVCSLLSPDISQAQSVDPSYYQEMDYRLIGPFRASRTVGGVGIPSQPNVFFVGVNNGGVWKTDDYGRTWFPIFDDAPTGSVGDIAVSPSNPDILYVGSGEGLHRPDLGVGDGIFKSINGGDTWEHVGLPDVQQVGRLIVHPTNPDVVYVAGLGHPYGANEERGVFRTKNGGNTWEKVLYINHNTGAIQVEFDPTNPQIIYADLWEHQEGPWENAKFSGPNSGLYKSTDGGDNWTKLTEGLPTAEDGLGRIGVGIAPSDPNIIYATVHSDQKDGIYKSADAGASWTLVSKDRRVYGRGSDFAEIKVHPNDPNKVYAGNVASYQSNDGGKTWFSLKGAPGGDDYHRIWINPENPDIMLFVADQGAVVTVNAGRTWSSWYNQPTTQLYHVSTDNAFPYWVYGGQQESGAIATASRGPGGQITFREFMGVGADEYAYVAPDPKNPNIIYGGRVMRFDKTTGQSQNIAPEALRSGKYRILRTMPLMFHPKDDSMLLFATNVLWKTTNEGQSWNIISPDLTREQPEVPESVGDFKTAELETMARRAVIYAVSPSPLDVNMIWAGTDDGLVHVTTDGGKNWKNVTPPDLKSWDKVSQIDAGHFDKQTAFIAINAIRKDNMKPLIYKTKDGGKTWTKITNGMAEMGPVNVIREDPKQAGLLFAGTEREVYFSIDEGENWQSLRMDMPASSVRDLVIKDADLVVGTHGRSAWIMDNIEPLRQMAKVGSAGHYLFKPTLATRVRWNMFLDTPLPPEEPSGENPPDGTYLDYFLSENASEVSLEILDSDGDLIRKYSSADEPEFVDTTALPHPTYWIKPWQSVKANAGHHRFVWDLRYSNPPGSDREFAISAVHMQTPSGPNGPYVHPGEYTVRLNVDGKTQEQNITVRLDPRVEISETALQEQTEQSMLAYNSYLDLQKVREALDERIASAKGKKKAAMEALRGRGNPGNADMLYGSIYATEPAEENIVALQQKFLHMLVVLQGADAQPTAQAKAGLAELRNTMRAVLGRWDKLK